MPKVMKLTAFNGEILIMIDMSSSPCLFTAPSRVSSSMKTNREDHIVPTLNASGISPPPHTLALSLAELL